MSKLQPLSLSPSQCRDFKRAYGAGDVRSEVLFNLLHQTPEGTAIYRMGFFLMPVPHLTPVHFKFEGNRPYVMQVVSNGEMFGLLSHERLSKKERESTDFYNTVRMELITSSELPFVPVSSSPTPDAILRMTADYIEWNVREFSRTSSKVKEVYNDFPSFPLSVLNSFSQTKSMRAAILAGGDPRTVLAPLLTSVTHSQQTRMSPRP